MMNGFALCWVQHNHTNYYHLYERSPYGGRFLFQFEQICLKKLIILVSEC